MEFDDMQGAFRCDWITVYSEVKPQSSELWRGSCEMGRFERVGSLGALRASVAYEHSRWVVTLSGEPLRAGVRVGEFLSDIWPMAPLTCQRVDWAWQMHFPGLPQGWTVFKVAEEVKARLPHTRYGWDITHISSVDGETCYIGALGRPDEDKSGAASDRLSSARKKPLFVRVYQKVGQRLRIEAECKKLSGVPLKHALQETAAVAASFMPGRPSWTSIALPEAADVVANGNSAPMKLLKQAWGFMRCASVRTGFCKDGRIDSVNEELWARLVANLTGLQWQGAKQAVRDSRHRDPVAVIQGVEFGDVDLARTVPIVKRTNSEPPSSEFFRHFCGRDE